MSAYDGRIEYIPFTISDVSTAGQTYVPVPGNIEGDIVEIRSCLGGAIGTADVTLTAKIGGTAVTGGAITITQIGSAAGDTDVVYPTAANSVAAGDAIEIETDGASTNTVEVTGLIGIKR